MLRAIWHPENNERHIAEHGLTRDEVEYVLDNPTEVDVSRSSGSPLVFGFTATGKFIAVIFIQLDELFVYPVTAYEVK